MSDNQDDGRVVKFTIANNGKSITCHRCGKTSFHLEDVRNRYCGHCHVFNDYEKPMLLCCWCPRGPLQTES